MATYKRRKVESALVTKGFRRTNSHHAYFIYYTEDGLKTSVRTRTSHGSGGTDIDDSLIPRMAKQCKLPVGDFRDLIDCPLSRTDYDARLIANGEI